MTSSDEGQDRELLKRYAQASDADPRAPSAAVRAAILEEGRRVAASLAMRAANIEPERRRASRWKTTAWGTAAAALLAALVIAPRLWNPAPSPSQITVSTVEQTTGPAAKPSPEIPVMPAPAPRAQTPAPRPETPAPRSETMAPRALAEGPSLRPSAAPSAAAEVERQKQLMQSQLASLDNARSMSSRLAASGAYAQRSTNASTPPLTAAAAAGDLVKTRALLDQGAAIDDRDATGRTPLMLAVGQNQIDTVRLLLTRGADPNAADQHGLTPLQLAQQSNFDEIAALLIKAGAH